MPKFSGILLLLLASAVEVLGHCSASRSAEPVYVAGADRLLSDNANGNLITAGEMLIGELNCTSCHAVSDAARQRIDNKPAPVLTTALSRLQPDYVRHMLANPGAMKPGTTMPDLLHGVVDSVDKIESLVHYLAAVGGLPRQDLPLIGTRARGEQLFHRVGCAACHGSQQEGVTAASAVTPLGTVTAKYTLPGLTQFLIDPLHVRPGGRMPDLNLSDEEARAIAAFLLKLPEVARMRYAYYEGSWSTLPDFASLAPIETGGAERISAEVARRRDHMGLTFEGYLRIDSPGTYQFYLGSDDGSRLRIDSQVVIDNDQVHPYSEKSAQVTLDAGVHAVQVDYFEQAGEERLTVEFEGPETARQPLDARMTAEAASVQVDIGPLELELDDARVQQGRELFSTLGCAACHELFENQARVASQARSAPNLARVAVDRGCLHEQPPSGAADYEFSTAQRAAIVAAIQQIGEARTASPAELVHRTLAQFQCYACHERNGFGGITETSNAFFQTAIPEMGEEGRVPPTLTGVGGKLTRVWLEQILANGAKDRPYMFARMPQFGRENVGHLGALFESLDTLEVLPAIHFAQPAGEVKEAGRQMVGAQGFSCIKCHTFGRFPAEGIQAINLQRMGERLRVDWFRRYMRNPQEFRPGTRMPSAWPPTGKSLLDQFFDGDVEQQIAAVWVYLSDADRARIPSGLMIPSMELVPVDRTIIYRNFITGAGTRGIGVGYPEGIHQAYDANNLQIAFLWHGRFMDASRHWTGRGDGFQPPAGDQVLQLATVPGPPLAVLENLEQSWPTESARQLGFHFRGYRLTKDGRPTFRYEFQNVQVEEFLNTQYLGPGDPVVRKLTFVADKEPNDLWFRVAAGSIQDLGDDWYRIDDRWRVQVDAVSQPILRSNNSRHELLVKIEFQDRRAEVTEKIGIENRE